MDTLISPLASKNKMILIGTEGIPNFYKNGKRAYIINNLITFAV